MDKKFVAYTQERGGQRTECFVHAKAKEVYYLQEILDNFGTGQGDVDVMFPEFYKFLMTAKVGESKCGMYGQGSQSCWQRQS